MTGNSPSNAIKIRKWSLIQSSPDIVHLNGHVYDHPGFEDDELIISSPVVYIDLPTRIIKTYSGSTYHLQDPHPDFVKWLTDNGFTDDLDRLFPN